MADIQEQHQEAIASLDEKGTTTEYTKTEGAVHNNNDEETGPSNMVSRARQSLSDLFTIVTSPKYTSRKHSNANLVTVRGWLCPNFRRIPEQPHVSSTQHPPVNRQLS